VKFDSQRMVPPRGTLRPAQAAVLALFACGAAQAMDLNTGVSGLKLRWDNTVKYSAAYRRHDADPVLAGDANLSDGDNNFARKGLVSSRFDLLSELEASTGPFGVRLSGAAWYDSLYNRGNHNVAPLPVNYAAAVFPGGNAQPNDFVPYTRSTHGRNGELLDAFVSGRFDLGGHATTLRLGKHTVVWGETLFFGDNGIAGGMVPIDVAKALSVPNLRYQEVARPVNQVSGQFQINEDITAYAYYQLNWVGNRSQGSGSYFSPIDFQDGGDLIFTGPTSFFTREGTRKGKDGGQGGVSLRIRGDDIDYGLYAVRFNAKSSATINKPDLPPTGMGTFYDNYHNGINAFGASANKSAGLFNYAMEVSMRQNQDLFSPNAYDVGAGPQYAVGKTAHFNISAFGTSLGKSPVWDDALLLAEVAYSRVLSITRNANTMSGCGWTPVSTCQPNGTRSAWRFQTLFEPVLYQAFPGVDLRFPMGLSYVPKGSRNMVGPAPAPENAGSINVGISSSYLDVWRAGLSFNHFYGARGGLFSTDASGTTAFNYRQYFGDRDYLSFNLSRTF
jgi:hypothetical protein